MIHRFQTSNTTDRVDDLVVGTIEQHDNLTVQKITIFFSPCQVWKHREIILEIYRLFNLCARVDYFPKAYVRHIIVHCIHIITLPTSGKTLE